MTEEFTDLGGRPGEAEMTETTLTSHAMIYNGDTGCFETYEVERHTGGLDLTGVAEQVALQAAHDEDRPPVPTRVDVRDADDRVLAEDEWWADDEVAAAVSPTR